MNMGDRACVNMAKRKSTYKPINPETSFPQEEPNPQEILSQVQPEPEMESHLK